MPEGWSAEEIAAVKASLQTRAQELRDDLARQIAELDEIQRAQQGEGAGDDQADVGSKTFEREHEMALAENSRELLAQVERALDRIAAGTYGRCENCGNPIPKARMQAFPSATLCVTCKEREERR
ncbi:MAG: TraR/DksA family transcriptional regulator [Mycobacteriales bacterium]